MPNVSDFYFTRTVTVQRPTVTKSPTGGAVRDWAAVSAYTDLPASVQPMAVGEIHAYAGRQLEVDHNLYIQSDPGLVRGDRLAASDGRIFTLVGVVNYASFDRLYKVVCLELLP